jgi:thiol-disulfide isomerase/thioredoxin
MKSSLVSSVSDILTGLAALPLFALADNYLHAGADLRIAVMVLAFLYLSAGLFPGHGLPKSSSVKGRLISSGGSLALLLLGWGSIHRLILAILLVTANLLAIVAVNVRRLWAAKSRARAVVMALVPLAALAVAVVTTIPTLATRIATRKTTAPAAKFSIRRLDGTVVSSSEFRGRVIVLDFWATWCLPCRRQMPELEQLYRRYQGNSKISFWAVDVQKDGETPEKAREFMQKAGYTLPVACAGEESLAGLSADVFPSLVIIDKSGQIRLIHRGYDGSEQLPRELSNEIDTLLEERP